ncbi:MAG: coproporphyrinogen-III oxidase family protein [Victivallaceae bacterium]
MSEAGVQVYLHVPFCRAKCGYCAFYSESGAPAELRGAYLAKLATDLERAAISAPVETLYLGGGTPTLLSESELETLFAVLRRHLPLRPDAEISIEANPETITAAKAAVIAEFANRVSLGVQSFDPSLRQILGRDASDEAIATAIELLAGRFRHFNLDLIYAIPGQTLDGFAADLARAAGAGIDHLSCYSLTPEEGTRLSSIPVDDDFSATVYEALPELLAPFGLARYEISNYARPGCGCRHNLRVWEGSILYGFGPAAAGFDGKTRLQQPLTLDGWLAGEPPELDELSPAERRREIAAMNLRTVEGWGRDRYLDLPGATTEQWRELGAIAARFPDLLFFDGLHLKCTRKGLLFWDEIAMELLA